MPRDSRFEFSHPDVPIDRDRLRAVLADGRAASSALTAFAGDPRLASGGGRHQELLAEAAAVRETAARHGDMETDAVQSRLAAINEQIREARKADAEARAARIRRRDLAVRCAKYAIERRFSDPELQAFRAVEIDFTVAVKG